MYTIPTLTSVKGRTSTRTWACSADTEQRVHCPSIDNNIATWQISFEGGRLFVLKEYNLYKKNGRNPYATDYMTCKAILRPDRRMCAMNSRFLLFAIRPS